MNTIKNISNEAYHQHPGVSRSMLMDFRKTPRHYWHKYINPDYKPQASVEIITKRQALEIGNAVHTRILEPDMWDKRYVLWDGPSRVTKAGKEAFAKAKADAGDKQLIDLEAYEMVAGLADAALSQPEVISIIEGTKIEQSLFWQHQASGLDLKARPDIWCNQYIADLKTVANASPESFEKSIFNFGYHIQAAMQLDAVKAITGETINNYLFLVIEKEAPYAVAIYQLDEMAIAAGRDQVDAMLDRLRRCYEQDTWPCYETTVVSLPSWANKIMLTEGV